MSESCGELVGAIEAGGTKFICAVGGRSGRDLLVRQQFATGADPVRLMTEVVRWFGVQQERWGRLAAVGE